MKDKKEKSIRAEKEHELTLHLLASTEEVRRRRTVKVMLPKKKELGSCGKQLFAALMH